MIKIKSKNIKRTKISIAYEFDHEGVVHERTASFKHKEYLTWSSQELISRIRGLANRERAKISKKNEKPEEMEKEE